jgi:hypothetical protein
VSLLTGATLVSLYRALPLADTSVELDISISRGGSIELFVNDLTIPPQSQPIKIGQRQVYTFSGITRDILMLRVDPTDAGDVTLELHGLTVRDHNGIKARFDAPALAGWQMTGLAVLTVTPDVLTMRSIDADPILSTVVQIPAGHANPLGTVLALMGAPDVWWRVAALALVLLVLASSFDPARRFYPAIAVAVIGLVVVVLQSDRLLPDGPGSAAVAVSRATFVGKSTQSFIIASSLLIVGGVAIGLLAASLGKPQSPVTVRPRRAESWTIAAAAVALGVGLAPDLYQWGEMLATRQLTPHWDGDSATYWASQFVRGSLPLRDYWYPYFGSAVFDARFPLGPALRWLYETLLFTTLFAAVARWRGSTSAVLVTAVMVIGHRVEVFPATIRYLPSATVLIAWAGINRTHAAWYEPAVFWAACALALFIEPPQLIYAGLPISLLMSAAAYEQWRSSGSLRVWLQMRVGELAVPLILLVLLSVLLLATGQFGGALELYGGLGDAVAYSAFPTGLPEVTLATFPRALLALLCAVLMVVLGTFEYARGPDHRCYGSAMAGAGLVLMSVLQKHFIRPMDDQLLLPMSVCVLILAIGWPGTRRPVEDGVSGMVLGIALAAAFVKPAAADFSRSLLSAPRRAWSNLQLLADPEPLAKRVQSEQFSEDRFRSYVAQREVVAWVRANAPNDVRLFALTDNAVLYLLTGQPTVWLSNLYDGSPVDRQARIVSWLEEERIPFAVVAPDGLRFDGFQTAVRLPLVYSAAAYRYVPLQVVGGVHVLRRRSDTEAPDLAFWRDLIGADLNLGRLASVSSYQPADDCETDCGTLLQIEVPPGTSGVITVPITVGGLSFSVSFTATPRDRYHRVLAERLWFWSVGRRAGLPVAVDSTLSEGVRVTLHPTRIDDRILY